MASSLKMLALEGIVGHMVTWWGCKRGVRCQLRAVGSVGSVSFVGSGSADQPAEVLQEKTTISLSFTTRPS